MLLSRALERAGYGTMQAESAEKAKEILKSGEPIILIISDLTMPGTDVRELRILQSAVEVM